MKFYRIKLNILGFSQNQPELTGLKIKTVASSTQKESITQYFIFDISKISNFLKKLYTDCSSVDNF